MSGSYSIKGTTAMEGGRIKKGSHVTNGNGPPPIIYPADPPDDENMNEIIDENIDLTVVMPDGVTAYRQSIEPHIPMMDLLVNLAGTHKLNPAAHTLVVQTGERFRQIDFKANKTIGLLADENQKVSVQIVKKQAEQKVKQKSTVQPFEMTYRFTVNLPQNQKKVLRISPKLLLGEVRQIVCQDKGYDPTRYVFLLPGKPTDVLDDVITVGDLKSSEINFIPVTMLDAAAAKSFPDLAFAASQAGNEAKINQTKEVGSMPPESQKRSKSRFLSFLGKKDKKFKIQQIESTIEESSSSSRPKKSESFNVRPKTVYTETGELDHFNLRNTTSESNINNRADIRMSTGSNLIPLNENVAFSLQKTNKQPLKEAPPKKSGKKRAAPPPPQVKPQTVQVEIEVKPKTPQNSDISGNKPGQVIVDIPDRVPMKRFHSRNSSDSSGYHELTLSGADSPDGAKVDNSHTTLDTTSINSADHFNGDSGIRDMSPVRSHGHNKGNKKTRSRDSSLDNDKPEGLVPGGKKKKRAPLPPPDVPAQTPVNTNITASVLESQKEGNVTPQKGEASTADGCDTDDELEAIKAMEEVTMKFNIEDSEDEMDSGMRMVEDSSIYSEDFDADLSHRQRPPATFIAPPPPTEPPPADSEPVDRFGQVILTTDIGVGDDTTASPRSDSVKSSPVSIQCRRDSQSSNSSVNTLEDLSLAFKQTIAMGEEALGLDSDLSDNENVQDELQKEMGEFKDKINQLADEEADKSDQQDHNESNNSKSSFIVHEAEPENHVSSERLTDVRGMIHTEGNRESSEITYEFTIDAVPAEFQNNNEDSEEEQDYYYEEEEIVEILPVDPQVFNLDSPRSIPDLDSPKEHKSMSLVVHDSFRDQPVDNSTPKDVKQATKIDKVEQKEFVISLDELSNVDFSVAKPKEENDEEGEMKQRDMPKVNYRIEFRNSRDYDTDEDIHPQSVSNVEQMPVFQDNENLEISDHVKNKCSELNFTPDYETEVEHVMEEKSISMINLPVERTPVKNSQETFNDINETYASSTNIVLNNSMSSQGSEKSPRKDDGFETQNLLQAQYQQLQQQFAIWQGQLSQNQQLLATNQGSTPSDDKSNLQFQQLNLQIQMQQQMLLQVQQNMHALTLQNSLTTAQQPMVVPVTSANPVLNQPAILPTSTVHTHSIPVLNQKLEYPSTDELRTEIPNAPPPPMLEDQPKKKKTKQRRIKERPLEPREQLMLDVRNFGKTNLNKVPVKATHWHK